MNERTIFTEALERETATERSAYLDAACAGDEAIRGRVEALLRSHDQAGTFLGKPVPERLGEGLAAEKAGDDTQTVPSAPEADDGLDFLEPSDKPGVLGRLGHYEVLEVLGRGGMGVVLRAFDEQLHRVVAIKVMAAQLATNGAARRRFTREARAAAAVSHDHVVTIHAVEDASPRPHIVMQYVAGASLQERLDRTGPLPLPEILRIGMQAAAGLAAAHAQGLVHRDVKPANILLENGVERVKLTDFGLARAADDASLTQSGAVAGTPSFMSPEQAEGRPVEQRSDLFSLGSALYAMCTGRPPFRAGTNIGVLKRVCEETPTPIRETNPEVPDWLAAVVEKLHAKDPAGRFQTAAEVAELLGQYLAHVQHPSAVALPAVVTPAAAPPPSGRAARHHRWAVAAAVLVALFAVLGTTEATGVTNVRATVTRILTPDGTLVVETDDPDVKVTVEGDGGLVVTGAGLQEIRLKPGSYRVLADRDGKRVPLDRELVTVSRRGREIVRVKLEAPSSLPAATAEKGAFVLLAAGKERKFDTLAEVVLTSADGDTIEIRGNGPFITQPISINNRALVIRAGAGFLPVIKADPDEQGTILLNSNSLLVLEGLDLQWVEAKPFDPSDPQYPFLVTSGGPTARLYAVNCRFLMNRREGPHQMSCIGVHDPALCHLRNCQLLVVGHGAVCPVIDMLGSPNTTVMVDNCLTIGQGMTLIPTRAEPTKVFLNHNTFLGPCFVAFYLKNKIDPPGGEKDARAFSLVSTANIFGGLMTFTQSPDYLAKEMVLSARDTERLLSQLVGWQDNRNLYCSPEGNALLELFAALNPWPPTPVPPTVPITTLLAWKNFWGMEELNSRRGQAKFQGGDLVAKAQSTPELIVPEDFRLRADSAGYRAGKDGKDLGADVDLVGPGAAYERWKKTPEYQQWLKDTGQLRAEAPKPEPGAFVLLAAGKERKFDTLAEAVQHAADGDTIEVRGNGPFATDHVEFRHAVAVRAGIGFRPVLTAAPRNEFPWVNQLASFAPLRLEGLEVHCAAKAHRVLDARGPLRVSNCRFLVAHSGGVCVECNAPCVVQNCELVSAGGAALAFQCDSEAMSVVTNNLLIGHVNLWEHDLTKGSAIRFTGNTLVSAACNAFLHLTQDQKVRTTDPLEKRVHLSVANNVITCGSGPYGFLQYDTVRPHLSGEDAERWVRRRLDWRDEHNSYQVNPGQWIQINSDSVVHTTGHKTLADWNTFWGLKTTGSLEGVIRFRGGDPISRALTDPLKLAPEDVRLRPDSAGYRAGKDGKDLGADVDLVGPGAAYERWKKTPGYQAWLKDTEQVTRGAGPKAFVLLGGKGVAERNFETLVEAVSASADGDTIEVRGNGPFVSDGAIANHSLVIRAGTGYTPSILLGKESAARNVPLFGASNGRVVLEGLELMRVGGAQGQVEDRFPQLLLAWDRGSLHIANCRLIYKADSTYVTQGAGFTSRAGSFSVRNSVLTGNISTESTMICESGGRYDVDNCVCAVGGIVFSVVEPGIQGVSVRLRRNTLVGNCLNLTLFGKPKLPDAGKATPPIHLECSGNVAVWDMMSRNQAFLYFHQAQFQERLPAAQAEAFLPRLVALDEKQNVYRTGTPMLRLVADWQPLDGKRGQDLADWNRFWGLQNTGSVEGEIRFQGGDLIARARATPEQLTAEDFRLRPDSTGYRAGKDGKDLGADVDLVGPGPAYERWKKTPDYQQWLKESVQQKK